MTSPGLLALFLGESILLGSWQRNSKPVQIWSEKGLNKDGGSIGSGGWGAGDPELPALCLLPLRAQERPKSPFYLGKSVHPRKASILQAGLGRKGSLLDPGSPRDGGKGQAEASPFPAWSGSRSVYLPERARPEAEARQASQAFYS